MISLLQSKILGVQSCLGQQHRRNMLLFEYRRPPACNITRMNLSFTSPLTSNNLLLRNAIMPASKLCTSPTCANSILGHEYSFGQSENLSKIFLAEILVFHPMYVIKQ